MPRKKRQLEDARPVNIYMGATERLILSVIEVRRQEDGEERDSPSEIVSDALRKLIVETEGMPIEQIEALRRRKPEENKESKRSPKKSDKPEQ